MTIIKTFGDDLAFAGVENVNLNGIVNDNGQIYVDVEFRGAIGCVGTYESVEQAEDAILIVHRACLSENLVDNDHRFDLAVGLLSLLANKSFYLPEPTDYETESL
jgi:hypothetical protein